MEFENLAHLRAEWVIEGAESDGEPIEVGGMSTEVVRRQSDGQWLYIIDHPFGSD